MKEELLRQAASGGEGGHIARCGGAATSGQTAARRGRGSCPPARAVLGASCHSVVSSVFSNLGLGTCHLPSEALLRMHQKSDTAERIRDCRISSRRKFAQLHLTGWMGKSFDKPVAYLYCPAEQFTSCTKDPMKGVQSQTSDRASA